MKNLAHSASGIISPTALKTLGKDGGLILGPTHHVQLDTPLENFWAMANTIATTPYSAL